MMLWFKFDSNAMEGRTFKRVARRLGNAGVGGLLRLFCFSAGHGKDPTSPGRCVDSDLEPIPREDLVEASGLSEEDFDALIETCVSTKCVDGAWADRGELNFPGMLSRCDEYAAKVMRRLAAEARTKGLPPPTTTATPPRTPPSPPETRATAQPIAPTTTTPLALVGTSMPTPRHPTRFDEWWALFPRKIEKKRARAAWTKLKAATDSQLFQVIMAGTQRLIDSGIDTQYVPAPHRYLAHRRFEDEPTPVQAPKLAQSTLDRIDATTRFLERHGKGV
jgi:hypothetical protein